MKLDRKPINSTTTLNDLSPILFESKENFLQKKITNVNETCEEFSPNPNDLKNPNRDRRGGNGKRRTLASPLRSRK